jgi:signal transduction histidine kinase
MADTWGTLANSPRADGAAHGFADIANTAVDGAPALPKVGKPAAGSSLAAETLAVEADPVLVRRYRRCAARCGYLVMAIGCVVLIGWLTGIGVLASLSPNWIAMKANTALGFLAAGSALCINSTRLGEQGWARQASRLCAVSVIVLASATLVEQASGGDLHIDQLLVTEPLDAIGTIHPGRMAPLAMLSFEIFGISLLTMPVDPSRWQSLTSTLALLATLASMVVLVGYVFGASDLYTKPGQFAGVAANTSIAFFVLGSGVLLVNLPSGPLRSLASPYLGGLMLRRMLPIVVVLIVAIVGRLIAQSHGLFETNAIGVASGTVVIIVAVAGILIWYAGVLDRLDGAQRHSDAQIRLLNAALNSRVLALEAANREFQGFSYSMSHVLRAPLRAIHGYAQIVLDDLGETFGGTEEKRLLGAMQSSAEEMSELLDGILAFLRLGWQSMTIVAVDMQQGVRAAITQLESKAAGRKIEFEIGELPPAQGDASMMQRLWLNLLDNAIKFTGSKDRARIEVGAQIVSGQTLYFVKDNGAGFDMRYAAKLFGVFQRLHDTTQFPGTGIGLAIVNRIIARHSGRVWAEGKPDEGATFYFSLPVREKIHA